MKKLPKQPLVRLAADSNIWIGDAVRMRYVTSYMPDGGGDCLDAGCGAACLYKDIVEKKGYKWTGVDLVASKFGACEDITILMYEDNYFDAVLCVDVLEHIKDYWKALSEIKRVLIKDGTLTLHVPNSQQTHLAITPDEQDDHVRKGFGPRELLEILNKLDFVNRIMVPSFNWNEALVWDFMYASAKMKPLNLERLLNFRIEEFVPYGILSVWRKR